MSFLYDLDELSRKFIANYTAANARACAAAYSEDTEVYFTGTAVVRGRSEMETSFGQLMRDGFRMTGIATLFAHSEGSLGYAIQRIEGDTAQYVMLALRRNPSGEWLVMHEAVIAA